MEDNQPLPPPAKRQKDKTHSVRQISTVMGYPIQRSYNCIQNWQQARMCTICAYDAKVAASDV